MSIKISPCFGKVKTEEKLDVKCKKYTFAVVLNVYIGTELCKKKRYIFIRLKVYRCDDSFVSIVHRLHTQANEWNYYNIPKATTQIIYLQKI